MIVIVSAAAPARAQVADNAEEEAMRFNRQSRKLYDQGRYAEAAELLRKAYRLKPVPILQYNLARACEGYHDVECALAAYETYLPHAPDRERSKIEALVNRYRKRLANWRAPASPMLQTALAMPPAAPPVQPAPPPQAPDAQDSRYSVLPPIAAATGGVAVGVGVYLVASALNENDDRLMQPTSRDADDKRERAESLMAAGNATMISGGIVAVVGVVWWILDRRASHRPPAAAQLHIGRGTVAIRTAF